MTPPTLIWFRRDLRLSDHPALTAACARGSVIPVFIRDTQVDNLGAAPKWRLGLGLAALDKELQAKGSRLIFRSGRALDVLQDVIAETRAQAVYWTRGYDPDTIARDRDIKSELTSQGVEARSFGGHLLFEPWTVETKTGGPYRVFTPFWKAVQGRAVDTPLPEPARIDAPGKWPGSEELSSWDLGAKMQRGAEIVARHQRVGSRPAQDRLNAFVSESLSWYHGKRDRPDLDGTSDLSANLALGEISPHQCWQASEPVFRNGSKGAESFRKELVWREFAYHLMYHFPQILSENWKPDWESFPWSEEPSPELTAWKSARTGVPLVDAGLRQMYVTGRMHNRVRMVVASYLTKHLLVHWRVGQHWFEDHLTDWDPASNAMGWQWVAGCGPDAAPFFRIFNPETQAQKFDPEGAFVRRWIAEGQSDPHKDALAYFDAIPRQWNMSAQDMYPSPVIDLKDGRTRALSAYKRWSD